MTFLVDGLHRAGISDVVTVEPVTGGLAALAGIATRREAPPVSSRPSPTRRTTTSSPRRPTCWPACT